MVSYLRSMSEVEALDMFLFVLGWVGLLMPEALMAASSLRPKL